ncbi:MAG TPA: glycosyltransferase, partial [bacterium]|nr:glycosyltransferase [bacterium]
LAKIYPSVAAHKHLEVLPVPTDPVSTPPTRNKSSEKRPLKVASLGNFLFYKGGDTIARVIPFFRECNIEFHIFGLITEQYEYLKNSAAFPFVRIHGVYQPGKLPEEINTCDVSLHLSTWPETYCMSLSEAWDRGLVPIVTDIGALGERVTDGVNGLKIRPDSEGDLEQAIRRLMETPGLLETLRKNIKSAPISRTDTHMAGLKKIYSQAIAGSKLWGRPLLQADFLQFWHPVAPNWAIIDQEAAAAAAAEKAAITAKKNDSQRFKFARRVIRHIEVHGFGSLVRKSFGRVRDLARKIVRHLREKGIVSTLRRSVGYVKEKL